ncbi:hypothetical protein EZY14_009070 [Kordia sp. TARA_039_SRF]|nr:hypothetical protein EZY14_009070 [Kordia sp. TARA_039_SRF]
MYVETEYIDLDSPSIKEAMEEFYHICFNSHNNKLKIFMANANGEYKVLSNGVQVIRTTDKQKAIEAYDEIYIKL